MYTWLGTRIPGTCHPRPLHASTLPLLFFSSWQKNKQKFEGYFLRTLNFSLRKATCIIMVPTSVWQVHGLFRKDDEVGVALGVSHLGFCAPALGGGEDVAVAVAVGPDPAPLAARGRLPRRTNRAAPGR